jgi:release factor glutamine methyltransferase
VTVLEVIQRSTDFFSKKGVESPRLQVELLLAHALGLPRLNLYLDFARTLTESELKAVREMVKRRGNREPLQHILGSTSFCGLEIKVTPGVLIPRPETELLAENAYEFLNLLAGSERDPVSFLDLGTGSGCLAITIAVKCRRARGHAIDISVEALAVARENARHHGVLDNIQFCRSDRFDALPDGLRFNLIVSNPPYVPTAEIATLAPEVKDHDPRGALDGGPDGLTFYRSLAEEAGRFLEPGGKFMMEFGDGQAAEIRGIFAAQRWVVQEVKPDYTGRPRILIARLSES